MSETFKTKGSIVVIEEVQQISATFQKREFVIEIMDNNYKEVVKFELQGDKCGIMNDYQVGMQVEVSFNLKGRCWTNPQGEDKYFNTLLAWRISNLSQQQGAPPAPYQQAQPVQAPVQDFNPGGLDDEVPF